MIILVFEVVLVVGNFLLEAFQMASFAVSHQHIKTFMQGDAFSSIRRDRRDTMASLGCLFSSSPG